MELLPAPPSPRGVLTAPGDAAQLERDGDDARLTVQEAGIGIPAAEQHQLSSRFFRASNPVSGAVPGTGLGLSIVRGIVDLHGGTLAVHSREGEGTRVEVRIPLAGTAAGTGAPVASAPVPEPQRSNRAYRNVARVLRPVLRATTRTDWRGAEHLPADGGFIAASNHVTLVDPVTFAHFLYDHGVAPKILAKSSLFTVPVLGGVLRATGQIPVHRNTADAGRSLEAAIAALHAGECVAVFPEGTLTRQPDLWPMAGKTGIARLALTTRVPVVPVAQWGPQDLLAPYAKVPKPFPPKRVTVAAGPPVNLSDLYDRPQDTAVLREATERVMVAITTLLEGIRGERAPAERFVMRRAADGAPAADATGDGPGTPGRPG